MVTDGKTLYDAFNLANVATTQDERVAIECLVTRSTINEEDSILPWLRCERQFADGLTKLTARQGPVEQLKGGYIQLAFDPEVKGTKKNPVCCHRKSDTTRILTSNAMWMGAGYLSKIFVNKKHTYLMSFAVF